MHADLSIVLSGTRSQRRYGPNAYHIVCHGAWSCDPLMLGLYATLAERTGNDFEVHEGGAGSQEGLAP